MWCGSCTLREAFPELYNISCNKESSIADVMHFPNQRLNYDFLFSRAPQDWETEHFYTFLDLNNSLPLNGEGQDKLCWKSTGNENFKVSSISPFPLLLTFLYLGNLCGVLRSLLGLLSSRGLPH